MTDLDSCDLWLRQAWVEFKAPLARWPIDAHAQVASAQAVQDLLNALCLGDLVAARRLCMHQPRTDMAPPQGMALALRHLLPVIELIERDWQADRRNYADTLYAFWNIQRLMQTLSEDGGQASEVLAPSPTLGRLLLASAPGCQHHLGLWVVADHFRAHGWHVQTLLDAPVHVLIQAVRDERPDVLGLSVGHDAALQGVADLIKAIRHSAAIGPLRILMGGNIFKQPNTNYQWLGADGVATHAQEAMAICAHWTRPKHH
jgi:MerR family transcriptional regulator, light-induced transcriptional regulator